MKTKEEILAKYGVLNLSKIDDKGNIGMFALQITRDGYVHTTKMILQAMEEYGKLMYNKGIEDFLNNIGISHSSADGVFILSEENLSQLYNLLKK